MAIERERQVPRDGALTDEGVLRSVRRGDPDGLRVALERYEARLVGFLTGYLHDADLARDVAQEVFLRLVKKPPRRLHQGSLKAWLFRVARNVAADVKRKRRREVGIATTTVPEGWVDAAAWARLPAQDVAVLLGQLSDEFREVVALRIYGDLTFEEISEQCGIPKGTALWRMRRAMQILRSVLEKEDA